MKFIQPYPVTLLQGAVTDFRASLVAFMQASNENRKQSKQQQQMSLQLICYCSSFCL